ncbi:MAG: hypothetical protein ABJB86_07690 [Bacteroidota bacterium]
MEQMTTIQKLHTDIGHLAWDIKAEALLLLALERGLEPDEFMIGCDTLFAREFSNDIASADIKLDARKRQWLHLHLSRTGLYDQLPEGLFFQAQSQTDGDFAFYYKENQKKEEQIRKFFMPFENDFFLQRLRIEAEEAKILEGLKTGLLNEYFTQFWDLPKELPALFAAPLVLLIPYAHQVAGNMELTTHCLEQLLKEKVVIQKKGSVRSQGIETPATGDAILGLDFICGDTFYEDNIVLEIAIGPLKNSEITDYLGTGVRKLLIETFNRFFIPAGAAIEILVNVAYERKHMVIDNDGGPVLGYSSILGKIAGLPANSVVKF